MTVRYLPWLSVLVTWQGAQISRLENSLYGQRAKTIFFWVFCINSSYIRNVTLSFNSKARRARDLSSFCYYLLPVCLLCNVIIFCHDLTADCLLTTFLFWIDFLHCTFPSLHVAFLIPFSFLFLVWLLHILPPLSCYDFTCCLFYCCFNG